MSTQHTPGPWKLDLKKVPNGHGSITVYTDEVLVGSVQLRTYSTEDNWRDGSVAYKLENAEALATARLIAAAPDLLVAMRQIHRGPGDIHAMREIARAAIAKVKGDWT